MPYIKANYFHSLFLASVLYVFPSLSSQLTLKWEYQLDLWRNHDHRNSLYGRENHDMYDLHVPVPTLSDVH